MSIARGNTYIDTIQGYLNPRIYVALNLGISTDIQNVILSSTQVYPNPANDKISISSYAVKINELDIYDIPISKITKEFVETVEEWEKMHLHVAGDFIVMASTLMRIKAKLLLPPMYSPTASSTFPYRVTYN